MNPSQKTCLWYMAYRPLRTQERYVPEECSIHGRRAARFSEGMYRGTGISPFFMLAEPFLSWDNGAASGKHRFRSERGENNR